MRVGSRHRRRRSFRAPWSPRGRGALVLVVTLLAGPGLLGCSPSDRPTPPSAVDRTAPQDGPVAGDVLDRRRLEAPVLGAALSADGRTVTVYAEPAGGQPVPAGALQVQLEGADATTLVLRVVRRAAVAAPAQVCALSHELHVVSVALEEPLGPRAILDAATGVRLRPVPSSALLRPSLLPVGWRLLDERPLREGAVQAGWTQRYGRTEDEAAITVQQRRAELGPAERFHVDRIDVSPVVVRGIAAERSRQANWDATALVWHEPIGDGPAPAAWEVSVSSSSPDGIEASVAEPELIAFAAGLRAGPAH